MKNIMRGLNNVADAWLSFNPWVRYMIYVIAGLNLGVMIKFW